MTWARSDDGSCFFVSRLVYWVSHDFVIAVDSADVS